VAATVLQNHPAKIVISYQSGGEKWKRRLQSRQVDKHIIRRAAGALGLSAYIRQLIALRVNVDDLYLVNDPIAGRQQTGSSGRSAFLHECSFGFNARAVYLRRRVKSMLHSAKLRLIVSGIRVL
jgi:hypothetical protein